MLMALVLVPLAWSGLLVAAQRVFGRGTPDDRTEKRVLAVMLAPVLTAVLLLLWVMAAPAQETPGEVPLQIDILPSVMPLETVTSVPAIAWSRIAIFVLGALYLCGVGFGAARLLAARRRHRQWASGGLRHPEWQDVLMADMPMSAFADGRGTVVLSRAFAAAVTPEQVALTIAHERAHIRRRDPRYYAGLAWIDVVFWFNPFLRAQTRKCRLAAELACDAAVVAAAPSMRKAYAATIVAALQHAAGDALACAPAAISPRNLGDHGMRIGEIMAPSTRRGKRWAAFAFAAVLTIPAAALQLAYAQAATGGTPFMTLPLQGRISSGYGDNHPFQGQARFHNAVDIVAAEGAPIVAPAAGRVVHANLDEGNYGAVLEIDHGNGLVTRYAHLKSIAVAVGQHVVAGQLVAQVGNTGISTGPHLHLQVLRDGKPINPGEVFDLKKD